MKLGFSLPIAGAIATPAFQVQAAQHAEALGYHSLWVFQRLLYALEPQNEYPPMPGKVWPKAFESVADPLITLSYIAAVTKRIRLGTSVLIMPFYSPVVLAKQLATLDRVSGGRLDVGLGIGWSKDEYEASGVPYARRGARADEFLRCIKAVWTQDVVEFKGEFYTVPKARIAPKPVQKPHPPITYGGYGPASVKRAVALADGFNGGNIPLDKAAPLVEQYRAEAVATGRDPNTLHIISRGTVKLHDTPQGKDRRPLFGTLDEIREDIRRYADAGLTELFLEANFDVTLTQGRLLDLMSELAPR